MLSPIKPSENQPSPPQKESKPSLTIYAHQIAVQTSEVRSLLSNSLSHIAEDRNELHQVLRDTKDMAIKHSTANQHFEEQLRQLDEIVTKQQSTLSFLARTLTNMESNNMGLQDNIRSLADKLDNQNTLIQRLVEGQRETTGSVSSLQQMLETKIIPRGYLEMPEPMEDQKATSKPHASLDTIPTLPALTGQPPVLSDTESSLSIVIDTPAPANKPTKRPLTPKKPQVTKPAQSAKPQVGTQKKLRSFKRQRSLSPLLVVEATPDEFGMPNLNTYPQTETPSAGNQHQLRQQKSPIIPSAREIDMSQVKRVRKITTRRRILAGPATQEAWEQDQGYSPA
ncbi:hypothetical protein ABW19_dt0208187 [Dactylella cylindrospora]|nr:hypothetical protein ABW19_dt0208187 [Dactylella cylindrospora]